MLGIQGGWGSGDSLRASPWVERPLEELDRWRDAGCRRRRRAGPDAGRRGRPGEGRGALVGGIRAEARATGREGLISTAGQFVLLSHKCAWYARSGRLSGPSPGPRRIRDARGRPGRGRGLLHRGRRSRSASAGSGRRIPLSFKVYEPDRLVLGKRMEDHLRIGVCFWHSFAWAGTDMFGLGHVRPAVDRRADGPDGRRPHEDGGRLRVLREARRARATASTTATSRPRAAASPSSGSNLDALADDAAGYQERTGVRLLWGTANLFTHPRYQAGAATNPDPEVFAYAAAQVKHMLEVTQRLGGAELRPVGRPRGLRHAPQHRPAPRGRSSSPASSHLVAEHKHKIGFTGTLLIEPKPMEPTKHQYDYDSATVHGFLARHGLDGEYRLNIEANHATLAGHSFHHEVAYAVANGMFGSIDANRGDYQNGWDTDQFPNSVDELVAAALRDPAGRRLHDRRLQLRRQAAPPEHRPDRPLPRPHRRDRHPRPGAPGRRRHARDGHARRAWSRSATPAGAARSGPPILGGAAIARGPGGDGRGGRDRPAARSPGTRSCSRTSSTSTSGRWTAARPLTDAGRRRPAATARTRGTTMGHVLGIDASTTAAKAILLDESGAVRGIGSAGYDLSVPHPLWSEQDPRLWWDGTVDGDPRRPGRDRRSRATTSSPSASPARCTAPSSSTRRTRSSGRRSCGTTSGPAPSAT